MPEAFRVALSGRPGPVLIDVPKDVQVESAEFERWPEPGHALPAPAVDAALIDQAAALINASQRPILYLGGGVI